MPDGKGRPYKSLPMKKIYVAEGLKCQEDDLHIHLYTSVIIQIHNVQGTMRTSSFPAMLTLWPTMLSVDLTFKTSKAQSFPELNYKIKNT